VIVALPVCPATGVTVTVRLTAASKDYVVGRHQRRMEEAPVTVRLLTGVSTSPTVKLSGPVELFTLIVWFAMLDIVGGSFTALTVTTKFVLALYCPSLTLTVIVTTPFWLAAGLTVTVRLDPLPPKTMLLVGTSVALDDPCSRQTPRRTLRIPTVKPSAAVTCPHQSSDPQCP